MQAVLLQSKRSNRNGLLYPLLVVAAISVILFSAIGAAALAGWLPHAESALQKGISQPPAEHALATEQAAASAGDTNKERLRRDEPIARAKRINVPRVGACAECGVVSSIQPVEITRSGNGMGMVAGALAGTQGARGNGNAVATVADAGDGAYGGNEVEKHAKTSVEYKVRVHMPDGSYHTTYQTTAPLFEVGDRVRLSNGHIAKAD